MRNIFVFLARIVMYMRSAIAWLSVNIFCIFYALLIIIIGPITCIFPFSFIFEPRDTELRRFLGFPIRFDMTILLMLTGCVNFLFYMLFFMVIGLLFGYTKAPSFQYLAYFYPVWITLAWTAYFFVRFPAMMQRLGLRPEEIGADEDDDIVFDETDEVDEDDDQERPRNNHMNQQTPE